VGERWKLPLGARFMSVASAKKFTFACISSLFSPSFPPLSFPLCGMPEVTKRIDGM